MSKFSPQVLQNTFSAIEQSIGTLTKQIRRTSQKVYALDAAAKLALHKRSPRMPIEFTSQFGEDVLIWDLLNGQLDGFFIEVGGFDGYTHSVTYALEALGWSGLLVEAIPQRFEECKAKRPNSKVVNAACSKPGSTGTAEFQFVEAWGGTWSHLKSTPASMMALDTSKQKQATIQVPLTSLGELLKDHTGPIDVAVIDVEGAEIDVLEGFDLFKHKPRVLFIEDNFVGRSNALADYMATKPYVQITWTGVNRVYVRADLTDLQQRFATM